MAILIALVSIGAITLIVEFLNVRDVLPVKICAICAGTATTWIWMLAGILAGELMFAAYMPVVTILMGGSVVGIAYQGNRYLKEGRSGLLWKALFIPLGFGTVWSVANFAFGFVILGVAVLAAIAGAFLTLPFRRNRTPQNGAAAKRLEEAMKDCC